MRRSERVGGTATILVTDLVGSTAMFDRLGDERAERVLRSHLGELRELVRSFGGREVKSTGDGIMAAFPAGWLASECAVAMQRTLHLAREGGAEVPLHIRIGLHSGDTTADRHDYYGIAVAVAARLCDRAATDGILVSGVTRGLVGSRGGHSFADAGVSELKGIDEPVRAWTLDWGAGQLPPAPPPGLEPNKGRLVGAAAAAVLVMGVGAGALLAGNDKPLPEPPPQAGGDVYRVSVRTTGEETTGESFTPDISGDGGHVVFASTAKDLVPSDTNGTRTDVFHVDVDGGVDPRSLQLVSKDRDGQGDLASTQPAVSDDGNVVAFLSEATNLAVKIDENEAQDVFMRLVEENETQRVSIGTEDQAAKGASFEVDVSGNGKLIAFTTAAANLAVQPDTNERNDIFVRDTVEGKTNRANIRTRTHEQANKDSSDPSLSEDGTYVAFASPADTLTPGDTNNRSDVFRYNREHQRTIRASVVSGGDIATRAAGASSQPSISDDGNRIAFVSTAENLVEDDTDDPDVFVHDFTTQETILVTDAPQTGASSPADETANPAISGDGRWVVFDSTAANLVPDDRNGVRDVFLFDLLEETMVRLSVAADGGEAQDPSFDASISDDGTYVVFTSKAGLVPDDANEVLDVYLRGPLNEE